MVTGFYAAVLSIMLVALTARVIGKRIRYRIGIGTGGNEDLALAVRVQGNFVEIVPWALILLLLMEMNEIGNPYLHLYGAVLVIARGLHAWGLGQTAGTSLGRTGGMMLTLALIVAGAVTCAVQFLMG